MQSELFIPTPISINHSSTIRTLAFYQPFASLMLHGKKETRWVKKGKKPPFPKGIYLFYTTKNQCTPKLLQEWSGDEIYKVIIDTISNDPSLELNGYAIGIGELVDVRLMEKSDESKAFVIFKGERKVEKFIKVKNQKKLVIVTQSQWLLTFKNIRRIHPFSFRYKGQSLAKQGVGILPKKMHPNIIIID